MNLAGIAGLASQQLRLTLCWAAVTLLVVTGCVGETDPVVPESALENYYETVSDPTLYRQAFAETIEQAGLCMTSRGFDLVSNDLPPPQWWQDASAFASIADPGYLISMTEPEASAKGFGYSTSLRADRSGATFDPFPMPDLDGEPNRSSPEEVAYANTLFGLVTGDGNGEIESETMGCLGEAEEAVGPISLPQEVLEDAVEELRSSAVYTGYAPEWRRCMATLGYDFAGEPLSYAAWIDHLDRQAVTELSLTVESPFSDASQLTESDVNRIESMEEAAALAHVGCTDPSRLTLQQEWDDILGYNT